MSQQISVDKSANIITRERVSEASLPGLLYLYEITLQDGQKAHFFAAREEGQIVRFNKQSYISHPIETAGFSWSPEEPVTPAMMQFSHHNLPQDFKPHFDNVKNGTVRVVITFAEECEAPIGTDGGSCFPPETWRIDRLERADDAIIQLALQPLANLQSEILPKRVILRDICQHRYRVWDKSAEAFDYSVATCPYVGTDYITIDGAPTDYPEQDSCSLTLEAGCKKRFTDELPFFGFPGLAR